MSTFVDHERRRQRWTALACVLIALVLTTLDQLGPLVYAIDAVTLTAFVVWWRIRRASVDPDA